MGRVTVQELTKLLLFERSVSEVENFSIRHLASLEEYLWQLLHTILRSKSEAERLWLIGRIMTHAKFEDIWRYLTIDDIIKVFPKLRLPPKVRQAWQRALLVWGYHV